MNQPTSPHEFRFLSSCVVVAVLAAGAHAQDEQRVAPDAKPADRAAVTGRGTGVAPAGARSNAVAATAPRKDDKGRSTPLSAEEQRANREVRATLDERDRVAMHPGDPLKLVGVEQDDNDIRSRTPILKQAELGSAMVDTNELHERALALYSDRAQFRQPLTSQPAMLAIPTRAPTHSVGRGVSETPENVLPSPTRSTWPWFVLGGAVMGAAYWWFRRVPTKPSGKSHSAGLETT